LLQDLGKDIRGCSNWEQELQQVAASFAATGIEKEAAMGMQRG
jgi:hypothetical protein